MPYPADHCLPIIDGQGADVMAEFPGRIEVCDDRGACRVASCDSTQAYGGTARRVRRVVVMWAGGPVAWLDDIEASGPGEVRMYYQCGGPPALSDEALQWTVHGNKARMQIDLIGADTGNLTRRPERELNQWGYCFAECEMHPVTVDYTADPGNPLISVCQDATDGAKESPGIKQIPGGCEVHLQDGHYARFCTQDGRWVVAYAR
jgi:hypothetical protein